MTEQEFVNVLESIYGLKIPHVEINDENQHRKDSFRIFVNEKRMAYCV